MALIAITKTEGVPDTVIVAVVDSCDQGRSPTGSSAALASLPSSNPVAESALRVYQHAIDKGAERDTRRVSELIVKMLPDATEGGGRSPGPCSQGSAESKQECLRLLKRLRGDESLSHLATAFDSARTHD